MRVTQRLVALLAMVPIAFSAQLYLAAGSQAADPIGLTATLDSATYQFGEIATLTVTEDVAGRRLAVTDSSGIGWTKRTDSGRVITYTAAVQSSATVTVTLTRTADGARATASDSYSVSGQPLPDPDAASFALLGDTPYSDLERSQFPTLVNQINAESNVDFVMHAGDFKNAASLCSNAMYQDRLGLFTDFADPFVLSPGDNDWLDCHIVEAGQYLPTERLDFLRQTLYPQLGGQGLATVVAQANYPENVRFQRADVVFATVHVIGNGNGRSKWSGLPGGDQPTVRRAEFQARDAANLAWIDAAFDNASGASGVVLLMQAEPKATTPFLAIRNKIVARAQSFGGQVLLVHGDGHQYESEPSYAGLSNLTRLETFGETATRWLKVSVDPNSSAVFSWTPRTVS